MKCCTSHLQQYNVAESAGTLKKCTRLPNNPFTPINRHILPAFLIFVLAAMLLQYMYYATSIAGLTGA